MRWKRVTRAVVYPTFLVAPAPQPKQNQHFPFFFFFFHSLLSLRPNRRRGSPTVLSRSHAGWKPAKLSRFPTPFPAASPAAPSPQQHPGERGPWGEAMGQCHGARARGERVGTGCLLLAHVNWCCCEWSRRTAADLPPRSRGLRLYRALETSPRTASERRDDGAPAIAPVVFALLSSCGAFQGTWKTNWKPSPAR